MGTLDNWDPSVADPLASGREVILFDNAGVGRSTGTVFGTVDVMAAHVLAFLDGVGMATCDVLGFSLGGMVAQRVGCRLMLEENTHESIAISVLECHRYFVPRKRGEQSARAEGGALGEFGRSPPRRCRGKSC